MDIFISYSWTCNRLAEKIETRVKEEPAFNVLRDIKTVDFVDNLKDYMNSIRQAFCSIVIINESYLKSENCIYELTSLFKEQDFDNKIIPVVYKNTDIYSQKGIEKAISFWKNNKNEKLKFEINELRKVLNRIKDLKCIVYNSNKDVDTNICCENIMKTLIKHVFVKEVRLFPIESHQITLHSEKILCVDFGTCYTLASVMCTDGKLYMIPDEKNKTSYPSIIELHKDGHYLIGNAVSSRISTPNTCIIRGLKKAIYDRESLNYGSFNFSIKLLVAMFLNSVKRNAEEFLSTPIENVVLSIPVDYRSREIKIMEEAAQIAGLKAKRIIQESSATSFLITNKSYKYKNDSIFLNIDLGGGTLDISLAETDEGVCEILFSIGDRSFGSTDYDYKISQYVIDKLSKDYGIYYIYPDTELYSNIMFSAEKLKIDLDFCNESVISVEIPNNMGDIEVYRWEINRELYSKITNDLNNKLKNYLELAKANIENAFIDGTNITIYITGQGSKLFLVKKIISEVFPEAHINNNYQESAVCQGLTYMSGVFCGIVKHSLLLDNLHIYIDILCEKYDDKEKIIYIGSNNKNFHRLINPEFNGPIPTRESFEIQFDDFVKKNGGTIELFDYSPTTDLHVPFKSINLSANKILQNNYLDIDIDANGTVYISINDIDFTH